MLKKISEYLHNKICSIIKEVNPESIIDMGGTGKIKNFFDSSTLVIDANITNGIDCTKLLYKDNEFDVAVSIATLEHVGNADKKLKFLMESVRVSKYGTVHWFPFGKYAEKIESVRAQYGLPHPNTPITRTLLNTFKSKVESYTEFEYAYCKSFFLMLACTFPEKTPTYFFNYLDTFNEADPYGLIIVTGDINENIISDR